MQWCHSCCRRGHPSCVSVVPKSSTFSRLEPSIAYHSNFSSYNLMPSFPLVHLYRDGPAMKPPLRLIAKALVRTMWIMRTMNLCSHTLSTMNRPRTQQDGTTRSAFFLDLDFHHVATPSCSPSHGIFTYSPPPPILFSAILWLCSRNSLHHGGILYLVCLGRGCRSW